ARKFRRWLIAELLRTVAEYARPAQIMTVLLQKVGRDEIEQLRLAPWKHRLRKRLQRSGLEAVPVIGGFEVIYRHSDQAWVLHANLLIMGGSSSALTQFEDTFQGNEISRPTHAVPLRDPPRQLSYLLKFTT